MTHALKYGENPQQTGSVMIDQASTDPLGLFRFTTPSGDPVSKQVGSMSWVNLKDLSRGIEASPHRRRVRGQYRQGAADRGPHRSRQRLRRRDRLDRQRHQSRHPGQLPRRDGLLPRHQCRDHRAGRLQAAPMASGKPPAVRHRRPRDRPPRGRLLRAQEPLLPHAGEPGAGRAWLDKLDRTAPSLTPSGAPR